MNKESEKDKIEDHQIDFNQKEPIHPDESKERRKIKDCAFIPDVDGVAIEQIKRNTSEKSPEKNNWKKRLEKFIKSILSIKS